MAGVHLIIDEDDYLVNETAKSLYGDGTGLEVVDSATSTNAELQLRDIAEVDMSFSTPPFLDPRRVTWWKNVMFLPHQGGGAPSADVKEAMEKFAKKVAATPPSDSQMLIISGPKLLKTSVFVRNFGNSARLHMQAKSGARAQGEAAVGRVLAFAAELGLEFAPGAAELFVSRVGTDTRSLRSEIEKMRDWLGPKERRITPAAIGEVTSQGVGVEPNMWSVTDALGVRNLAKAIDAMRPFEGETSFAVSMTTVLEGFFRQLAELKDAAMRGRLEEATSGMTPWAARRNQQFLSRWRLDELRFARARFAALRERAVTSSDGVGDLVVTELVRACGRGGAR